MERIYESDFGGASYRSRDPIKNFKIKINLKRLSASTLGFLSQPNPTEGVTPSATNNYGQTILESEAIVVHWQQKFFSQREIEFYGFEPNCTGVYDYKYHSEVDKIKEAGGRKNKRLFTYINNDRFSATDDIFQPSTTSVKETESDLSVRVSEVRKRANDNTTNNPPTWKLNREKSVAGLKLIEASPTDEFQQNHHVLNTPITTLTIMADLSPEGQLGGAEFEYKLCTVEYNSNSILRVTPDFTRSKRPYRLEHGLSRDVWEFTVEHASNDVSKMEEKRKLKVFSELYHKHQNYLKQLVGDDFEVIPNNVFRLMVYGEIVSAESFENNNLHVEYFLDLPTHWSCDPTQMLYGCTQTCGTTLLGNLEQAFFSQPFNYQLFLNVEDNARDAQFEWPKLFVHVISVNGNGTQQTEGYSFVTLPTCPGFQKIKASCWRPTGNAGYEEVVSNLRRFFIGGSPELESLSTIAVPPATEENKISKYGIRTESTGSIVLNINCLQQYTGFQEKTAEIVSRKKLQSAIQLLKGRANADAIHGTMDSFLRARKRMQLARDTIIP